MLTETTQPPATIPDDMHNRIVPFGKYRGELWTRVPVGYLRWLINASTQHSYLAKLELQRRGTSLNYEMEVSGHAIDRASLRLLEKWQETRKPEEGLHSWLHRMASQAWHVEPGKEKIWHDGMTFCFKLSECCPTLLSVFPA